MYDNRDDRMRTVIDRLFSEAPKMEDASPNQAPAVDCQVELKNGRTVIGALSKTPEGTFRLMGLAKGPDQKVLVLEYYFDVSDVQAVVVMKAKVEAPASQIFQG